MAEYYVDFSAANDGDGTAPNQAASGGAAGAYNTILSKSFSSGDLVYIRRAGSLDIAGDYTATAGVSYIGWAVSGDVHYADRPAAGISEGWDSDVATHVNIWTDGANEEWITGVGSKHYRILFEQKTAANDIVTASGTATEFWHCLFQNTGNTANVLNGHIGAVGSNSIFYDCHFSYPNTTTITSNGYMVTIGSGRRITFYGCTFVQGDTSATSTTNFINTGVSTSQISFHNCLFEISRVSSNSPSGAAMLTGLGGSNHTFTDCTFRNSGTHGIYLTSSSFSNCKFIRCKLEGAGVIQLGSAASNNVMEFEVSSWTWNGTKASDIVDTGSGLIENTFIFRNTTFPAGNSAAHIVVGDQYGFKLFADNCTFPGTIITDNSANSDSTVTDITGGLWQKIGQYGHLISTSVVRTGGASFGIRGAALPQIGLHNVPLDIGDYGQESIYCSLDSGSNTVTVFGAWKGYVVQPPAGTNFWIELDYVDNAGLRKIASSRVSGFEADGDSAWVGDTGLTRFKMSVTVTTGAAQTAAVRIRTNSRAETGAYFYLDPKPVVT